MDDDIAKQFLKKYLERCKFKYVLAFMQWRAMQYEANLSDLEAIFKARHLLLIEALKSAKMKKGMKDQLEQLHSQLTTEKEATVALNVASIQERDELIGASFMSRLPKLQQQAISMIGINKKDTINTFEEIGWFDPDIES